MTSTVQFLVPCLVDRFLPEVGEASVRMLRDAGFRVFMHPEATCCGQPAFNAGLVEESLALVRRMLSSCRDAEAVVCPSGSCVAMIRDHYGWLPLSDRELADWEQLRSRVFELVEFLFIRGCLEKLDCEFPARGVVHDTCHHLRFIKGDVALDHWLNRVRGLQRLKPDPLATCCGFGGAFSVKLPTLSIAMGRSRVEQILAADPDVVILADAGCILHLKGILEAMDEVPAVPVLHYSQLYRKPLP